jgi:uncharacterized protein involved in response to NO
MTNMTCPPLFQHAFRVSFFLAAIWATAAIPLWLLSYSDAFSISTRLGDVNWHAHEMIFGYAALVICGFLFTAIPNWTGRLPVSGLPLAGLMLAWLAGRIAMLAADRLPPLAVAALDLLFLVAVLAVAFREIIAGKNWRNLRVLAIITWLMLANLWFHGAMLAGEAPAMALRAAVGALVALIILVGGRLTPSFTRNWLVKRGAARLPAPFNRFDALAIASGIVGAAAWVLAPDHPASGVIAGLAAVLLFTRLLRWRGYATSAEPLLLILHLGYAFIPLGFICMALAAWQPDLMPAAVVTHAWTAGAVGTMTLAVMTRATLGHTGHALTASRATVAIYGAVIVAAVLRMAAPFVSSLTETLLTLSGSVWSLAFAGFAVAYGPMLMKPRWKPKP